MAIVPGTSTVTSGNLTTGFTLVINSGVLADDILLIGITNRDATANPTCVDNDTGGNAWARITTQNAATNGSLSVWWKRATAATASKTITVSGCTGSASGVVTPYRGCLATGTPVGTAVPESNASGDETQAGITVGTAGSFVCAFVACTSNDTLAPTTFTATDPSALTDRGTGVSAGGSDCSCSHASAVRATAGATGNISWAQTNGTGASMALELIIAAVTSNASVSFTQASDTATITATVPASAAVSFTQGADTATITATVPALVSVSHTQDADTVAASVTVADAGSNASVEFTQANDTATVTATSAAVASVSFTQAADTNTITATVPALASASITQASDTATITATLAGAASVALTQAADTVSSSAALAGSVAVSFSQSADVVAGSIVTVEVPPERFAAVSFTQGDDTASITATAAVAVMVSYSQAADTVTVSATVPVLASVAFVQDADTVTASASEPAVEDYPDVLVPTGNTVRRRKFGSRINW
jgi:hypothetical protein